MGFNRKRLICYMEEETVMLTVRTGMARCIKIDRFNTTISDNTGNTAAIMKWSHVATWFCFTD